MTNDIKVSELMQGKYVFDSSERESQLRRSESLIEHLQACGGRLVPFVSGNMALSCSPELLRGLRGLADKHGVRLSYHVGLGAYEVDLVQEMHRMTPFRFARECGFLGPESVVAHCHYMNAEDLDLLAESGANVVHCPVLNSLRGAAAPIEDMLARDINVCLGLDNYFGDPFDVMRACISVARVRNKDATFLSATDALRFFTINAARAMGMDKDIGSIEVGKKADLQLVNLKGFGTSPVTDPVSTLVYHGHSSNVDTVLVDGEFVVREGELLTDSEEKLVNEVQEVSDRVWKRFSERFPELTGEQKAASQ